MSVCLMVFQLFNVQEDPSFDVWKVDPTFSMFWHTKYFYNRMIFEYGIDKIVSIILT